MKSKIKNKVLRGAVFVNNTESVVFLQMPSKNNDNILRTIELQPGQYSSSIEFKDFQFEEWETIVLNLFMDGNASRKEKERENMIVYHPEGEICLLSIILKYEALEVGVLSEAYRYVELINHSATIASCEVHVDYNQEGPVYSSPSWARSGSASVGYSSKLDLKNGEIKDLMLCYPRANVSCGSDSTSIPFLYSETSNKTIVYELTGTTFKTQLTIIG
ncbi:MAG: hypothetical protein ACRCSG_07390 [Cellulosilyticaceae bacterium]